MSDPNLQGEKPKLRFAPSPNGRLHLGHAFSALMNQKIADDVGGIFTLRIEDIDLARCTPQLEQTILDDLSWLELSWPQPVRRQSEHFGDYAKALTRLIDQGLAYPSVMTRGEIKAAVNNLEATGEIWPRDPDGAPLYPGKERSYSQAQQQAIFGSGKPYAWRLDMAKAALATGKDLYWTETGTGESKQILAEPFTWGDVILSRSDASSSYHLSVVVDDALQGISHVVRGLDLYHATSIHRLLQSLLGLPAPIYHHHRLILDAEGKKLSKSIQSISLDELRGNGLTPLDIRRLVGL